jgi:deoxyribodipyrimidine photo-lyase
MKPRILIWYRNDLRLHDHEPLHQALKQATVIPVYCFDPRQFGETAFGFAKTGTFRAQFLLESAIDLRQSFQALGSNLVLRWGQPEQVISALVKTLQVSAVHYHREATAEETQVEAALAQALQMQKVRFVGFWGHTLYHPDDLPFQLSNVPELFTAFRKQVEQQSTINPGFPVPSQLPALPPEIEPGEPPTLETLGLMLSSFDSRSVLPYQGGESAGQARLKAYIWDQDRLRVYKQTRNGMLGADYSSKFSAWLAAGCLSPRYIYEQVQTYEAERVRNDSTYWLIFELLWRDYFRFICVKHGNQIFSPSGLQKLPIQWKQDWQRFDLWRAGETGYPLIDANMRELAASGFMSNRGRQNVASFLTKNLGIDWRMGAEWFESILIDYDVCSNWGNWNYGAGVGNDARGFRYFNITKQAKDYDAKGAYVKHWLPELEQIPANKLQEPWKLSAAEQKQYGVRLGTDYPNPIVDLVKSAEANEKLYNAAVQRQSGR